MSHDPPDPFMDDKKTQKLLQETLKAMPQSVSESTTAILQAIETEAEVVTLRAKLDEAERERDEVRADHKEAIEVLTKGGVALNVHSASSMVVHAAGIVGQVHDLVQRAKQADEIQAMLTNHAKHSEAELVKATAACAEMRATLELAARRLEVADGAFTQHWACDFGRFAIEAAAARALLARTDLGRGMVAVPREMLESCRSDLAAIGKWLDKVSTSIRLGDPEHILAGSHDGPDGVLGVTVAQARRLRTRLADLNALLDGGKGR